MGGEISSDELSKIVKSEGVRLFSTVPCTDYPDAEKRYERWVGEGRYGSMEYLASHSGIKYRPGKILEGCRSILFIGMPYYCAGGEEEDDKYRYSMSSAASAEPAGKVAWYALGRDYHKTLKGILKRIVARLSESFPDEGFRPFVDSGPLDERCYAAGSLGFIGRHGLIVSPRYGSRFFLGEILSTALLPEVGPDLSEPAGSGVMQEGEPQEEAAQKNTAQVAEAAKWSTAEVTQAALAAQEAREAEIAEAAKRPGGLCPEGCRACIDACPTGALGGGGSESMEGTTAAAKEPEYPREKDLGFSPQRCISYLTIEYAGEIPGELSTLMGDRIFGCDTCQDVCPFNRKGEERARAEAPEDFVRPIAGRRIPLGEICALKDRDDMIGRFAGSPLMRCSVEQLKRNAAIAAKNISAAAENASRSAENAPVSAENAPVSAESAGIHYINREDKGRHD